MQNMEYCVNGTSGAAGYSTFYCIAMVENCGCATREAVPGSHTTPSELVR